MTQLTTIKVSTQVRDKLRAYAKGYRSMDAYLEHLLAVEDRRQMIDELRTAIAATPVDQIASWQAESGAWETAQNLMTHE